MITLTDNAAKKVATLITQEDNDNLRLRLYVSGGGCSGFQYGFTFDEVVAEDDTVIENGGVTLLVDAMSVGYLEDATVDYTEDLTSSQFVIKNPSAKATCGCGSSFAV